MPEHEHEQHAASSQDNGGEHPGMDHGAMGHATDQPDIAQARPESSASADHAAMGHGDMPMTSRVTRTQLTAVAALTVLALTAAAVFSAARANLTLSAHDVGGLVMPPGMIMGRETSAQSMRDMAAVDPREVEYTAARDDQGDQVLQPRIEDGVKVYDLETSVIGWNILRDTRVMAYAFNRQIPGPRLELTEGDRVRFIVTNHLPEPTTVHWHGMILPNAMDGAGDVTQAPIQPGDSYSYEFVVQQAGTFFYHSHTEVDRQQALGLYGALIINPRTPQALPAYDEEVVIQLQEWLFRDGYTYPAMPMEGALPNYFTINGKSYPETETVRLRVGERLRVRFIGSSSAFIHPMHIHGGPFTIVETDGYPVPTDARWIKDTVNVGPGERYDVIWEAREPGKWLLHCHINHHTTNDNREQEGGGGLMMIIEVQP
jgi:FtsP/CotA-like multicopper oxidase with cupredoxin domain